MRYHDYPKQLEEHYIARLRETYRFRAERLQAIQTAEQARAYLAGVRQVLAQVFGPLPERTPLNTRIWRVSEYEDYRIEHLTFESRPDFLITANLYVPSGVSIPAPAVLFTCGHYAEAKAGPTYVAACMRLAQAGFIVLSYDPINQGERPLYSLTDQAARFKGDCCGGHQVVGRQLHACGDWFGAWRLWDGLRALDCLLERPEVDPQRVGVTGNSGGGTMSSYLWAMEPRFRAVASSCWVTSYLLDLENSMPADEEQYPPGFLAAGLDKVDFFLARAGDPVLFLGQEFDFFDNRGLRQAYDELRRFHELLGGDPAHCRLAMDTRAHELSETSVTSMLSFFGEVLGNPGASAPQPATLHTVEELQVTPEGDVCRVGSRPMYELLADQARAVAAARPPVTTESLPQVLRRTLGVPDSIEVPHHRRLFQTPTVREATGQQVLRFLVETEPGLLCPLRRVCRDQSPYRLHPAPRVLLYLPNVDSQQELEDAATMSGEEDFWMLDVRGLGEGLYNMEDPYLLYGHDYMLTGYAVLYGETLLGDRLRDVLGTVRLLRAEGGEEVHLVGRRQGAILALLAGVLDPEIASVSSLEAPESFLALATTPFTFWPAVNFPRGVLGAFDLPQVREALGPRLVQDTLASPVEFARPEE